MSVVIRREDCTRIGFNGNRFWHICDEEYDNVLLNIASELWLDCSHTSIRVAIILRRGDKVYSSPMNYMHTNNCLDASTFHDFIRGIWLASSLTAIAFAVVIMHAEIVYLIRCQSLFATFAADVEQFVYAFESPFADTQTHFRKCISRKGCRLSCLTSIYIHQLISRRRINSAFIITEPSRGRAGEILGVSLLAYDVIIDKTGLSDLSLWCHHLSVSTVHVSDRFGRHNDKLHNMDELSSWCPFTSGIPERCLRTSNRSTFSQLEVSIDGCSNDACSRDNSAN